MNNKLKIAIILVLANLALAAIFLFFIPAFHGTVKVNPIIDIGILKIKWYGLTMALSILIGYLIARKNSWRMGMDPAEVDNLAFWLVIIGLLSARAYYVIFDWNYFWAHPAEVYKIWRGGLSIFGALIGGLVFVMLYARHKAYGKFQLLDLIALSLPLSQAIGRFGNFFNQEAFGYATDLPWKMYVGTTGQYHHPVFLYEALWSILVFFILMRLMGRFNNGTLGFSYLMLYSLGRFFLEPFRMDSVFVSGFRADQVVAFIVIVFSVTMLFRLNSKSAIL